MSSSDILFSQALLHIPGGVNSPVRAFKSVGGTPIFIKSAKGCYLIDEDDKKYIDYVGSWGPMIVGHAHPEVIKAVTEAAEQGLSFGAPTSLEVAMADKVCTLMPNIEKIRMVNSGTEAVMSAIRLARAYTERSYIIKFEGCYHGHVDSLLVKAGSGALTFGQPSSPGIPEAVTQHTLVATYNSLESVSQLFNAHRDKIAAVIIEPVAGNMNLIPAEKSFLEGLRSLCNDSGALLIFDEVMTGFRAAKHGAQSYYNIKPDLTTLGKVIGGGLPVGAFGGRKEIMELVAPEGPVYQAGTLSGNPIAMAAGYTTLSILEQEGVFESIVQRTEQLVEGLNQAAKEFGIPFKATHVGAMFGFLFTEHKNIQSFQQITEGNEESFRLFFHAMLDAGVYLAPSMYEAGFVSLAHTSEVIQETIHKAYKIFEAMKK